MPEVPDHLVYAQIRAQAEERGTVDRAPANKREPGRGAVWSEMVPPAEPWKPKEEQWLVLDQPKEVPGE